MSLNEDPQKPKSHYYMDTVWPGLTKNFRTNIPPKFTPLDPRTEQDEDFLRNNEDLGINTEDQLLLHSLRTKNTHLEKQREVLATKRQRTDTQAKIWQLI